MGWLIAVAVLCLLACLPLGFSAIYRQSQSGVWLLIGPLKFQVYPQKKKNVKTEKTKKKSEQQSKKAGSYRDFLPVIRTITEFLQEFRRKIRVRQLELIVCLGGDDPADLAITYGRGWALLGNLMPQLERLFVIKKRNLEVECDFTSQETQIYARLDATISLFRTVHLLTKHGLKTLKQLLELKKLRKGGARL